MQAIILELLKQKKKRKKSQLTVAQFYKDHEF